MLLLLHALNPEAIQDAFSLYVIMLSCFFLVLGCRFFYSEDLKGDTKQAWATNLVVLLVVVIHSCSPGIRRWGPAEAGFRETATEAGWALHAWPVHFLAHLQSHTAVGDAP